MVRGSAKSAYYTTNGVPNVPFFEKNDILSVLKKTPTASFDMRTESFC